MGTVYTPCTELWWPALACIGVAFVQSDVNLSVQLEGKLPVI